MAAQNACPACSKPVSTLQVLAGPEAYAIRCRQCGARLSKRSRSLWAVMTGIVAMIFVSSNYGWLSWQAAATFACVLVAVSIVALLRVKVSSAPPGMLDADPGRWFRRDGAGRSGDGDTGADGGDGGD